MGPITGGLRRNFTAGPVPGAWLIVKNENQTGDTLQNRCKAVAQQAWQCFHIAGPRLIRYRRPVRAGGDLTKCVPGCRMSAPAFPCGRPFHQAAIHMK